MKQLLSTKYSNGLFNTATLLLRFVAGLVMVPHGYDKLVHFAEYKKNFISFLGMGGTLSLALVVFSEFFCSIFVMLGLFTRLACIPLLIGLAVVVLKTHKGEIFGDGEHGLLFFIIFFAILLVGPGRVSADAAMGK